MTALQTIQVDRYHSQRGAWIYSVKKNGQRYAKPTWSQAHGNENSVEEIIERLERLNPGKRFEF
ncbi:MAG: hypothetical protein MJZ26_09230 [Fibrobacter sp.]|nr:hypothetical protein [Fibrobacter sp.]